MQKPSTTKLRLIKTLRTRVDGIDLHQAKACVEELFSPDLLEEACELLRTEMILDHLKELMELTSGEDFQSLFEDYKVIYPLKEANLAKTLIRNLRLLEVL